jgi:hypothetical protein
MFAFFCLLVIHGCATHAPSHKEMKSKILKPQKGKALVYVFNRPSLEGKIMAKKLVFEGNTIGRFWSGQYIYMHANPGTYLLPGLNSEAVKIAMRSGQIYFLDYRTKNSIASLLSSNTAPPYYEVMSEEEGQQLLKEFRLSGKFKIVTIDPKGKIKGDKYITPVVARSKPAAASKPVVPKDLNSLTYDDKTATGTITVQGTLKKRRKAFQHIEEICSTKNISMQVGSSSHKRGASYQTMDEKMEDGLLTIKFSCTY